MCCNYFYIHFTLLKLLLLLFIMHIMILLEFDKTINYKSLLPSRQYCQKADMK